MYMYIYIPVRRRIKAPRWGITTSTGSYTPVATFDLVVVPQRHHTQQDVWQSALATRRKRHDLSS